MYEGDIGLRQSYQKFCVQEKRRLFKFYTGISERCCNFIEISLHVTKKLSGMEKKHCARSLDQPDARSRFHLTQSKPTPSPPYQQLQLQKSFFEGIFPS